MGSRTKDKDPLTMLFNKNLIANVLQMYNESPYENPYCSSTIKPLLLHFFDCCKTMQAIVQSQNQSITAILINSVPDAQTVFTTWFVLKLVLTTKDDFSKTLTTLQQRDITMTPLLRQQSKFLQLQLNDVEQLLQYNA